MSIEPIGTIGKDVSKADTTKLLQTSQTQASNNTAPSFSLGSESSVPITEVQNSTPFSGSSSPGFAEDVMNNIYNEIDQLSNKLPKTDSVASSPVENFKAELSPKNESISAMQNKGMKDPKMEAVSALSKTFDHAVFMAMVNQVISGVSDTSRTLIKQS